MKGTAVGEPSGMLKLTGSAAVLAALGLLALALIPESAVSSGVRLVAAVATAAVVVVCLWLLSRELVATKARAKELADTLLERDTHLQSILDTVLDAMVVIDVDGKMLSFLSGGAKVQVPKRTFNAKYLPEMRKEALENAMRGMFDKLLAQLRDKSQS